MPDANDLASRIDAEFSALEEKYKKAQLEEVQLQRERQGRLQRLQEVFDRLRGAWLPSLEVLLNKFGDRVQVTPLLIPSTREAKFEFQSSHGRVTLRFSATTDRDVTKVILKYDLEIIPIVMQYDSHAELEFPLEAVDDEAVAQWINDRIISFVKTFLLLRDDENRFKDDMVVDPVADIRFPRFAAGATLDWKGKTYYFIGEETRGEFARKNGILIK